MTNIDDSRMKMFEELWHPICPTYDAITSQHVWKFFEAMESRLLGNSEPIYQVRYGRSGDTYQDADKKDYDQVGSLYKRIVYLAPQPTNPSEPVQDNRHSGEAVAERRQVKFDGETYWQYRDVSHVPFDNYDMYGGVEVIVETQQLFTDAPQQAIPAGWKLVPIEPTEEMVVAMNTVIERPYNQANAKQMYKARHTYKAMIAAAPTAPIDNVSATALEAKVIELKSLLEQAQNGLQWYQDEHPGDESEADFELHDSIERALLPDTQAK